MPKRIVTLSALAILFVIGILFAILPNSRTNEYESLGRLSGEYELWVGYFPSQGNITCIEYSFLGRRSLVVQGNTDPQELYKRLFTSTLLPYDLVNSEPLRLLFEEDKTQREIVSDDPLIMQKHINGQSILIEIDYSDWSYEMSIEGRIEKAY